MANKTNNQIEPLFYEGMPSVENREKVNAPLVKVIRQLLIGLHMGKPASNTMAPSYSYLLGQSIRQYIVPKENIHITIKANELWNKMGLSKQNMLLYVYQNAIQPLMSVSSVQTYKGTKQRSPITIDIKANEKIAYNLLFIEEHATPVKDVTGVLKYEFQQNNDITYQQIIDILDKMHIVRMLKIENMEIKKATGRISVSDYIKYSTEEVFLNIVNDSNVGYPQDFI